ncbi:MAG: E3 binding domain-containing protein [Anaerolineae bacterium]
MVYEVTIPILDQTTESVLLTHWLAAEGDPVQKGQPICQIETDKATADIEAPATGVLRQTLIEVGTEIPPLTVVALITQKDEPLPAIDPYYRTHRAKSPTAQAQPVPSVPSPPLSSPPHLSIPGRVLASPRAKRLAEEHGIDLSTLHGSGPEGRIQEKDVLQAIARGRSS